MNSNLEILIFDESNEEEYLNFKKYAKNYFQAIYKLPKERKYYILINKRKSFIKKREIVEILGYGIVENYNFIKNILEDSFIESLYSIPLVIIEDNPIIISDFLIKESERKKGYGKILSQYIINSEDGNISLCAVEDGPYFWPKFGFEKSKKGESVYTLKK